MSGWSLASPGYTEVDRFDPTATREYYTSVTADATPHTKGSWVELDASTSQDAYMVGISLYDSFVSGTNTGMLVDIGIGAAASEVVLISDILAGWQPPQSVATAGKVAASGTFRIYIPAGSRISARCQAVIASDTVRVGLRLLGGPNDFTHDMTQGGNVVTYGADTANSRGIFVAGAGSANTKGSWKEITASTTQPHSSLSISAQGHTDVSLSNQTLLLDVGFGAVASEVVLIKDVMLVQSSQERMSISDSDLAAIGIGRTIPIGSRLAARIQGSTSSNNYASICLHGVT